MTLRGSSFVSGEKDYKELMNKFECVSNAFLNLDEGV